MSRYKKTEALFLTRNETIALTFATSTFALAVSYGLAPTLSDILLLLPHALATSVSIELFKELARELVARKTGNWSEYRVWPLGLFAVVLSTVLFKTTFSVSYDASPPSSIRLQKPLPPQSPIC
ncbi:MAG: hypothetical protein ACE5KH_05450 [Candidatus Geothermarchaeales archaeon]